MQPTHGTEVAISTGCSGYPADSPYSPSTLYPEYPFPGETIAGQVNPAYAGVRDTLRLLGCDAVHYGKSCWNPLGAIVHPGDTVVVKPNLVRDFRETWAGHENCLITHGSVIRAALDYVYVALKGKGRIVIADAPQNDGDFEAIRRIAGLDQIREFYRQQAGCEVEIYDLRPEKARKVDGVIVGHDRLSGDPCGYTRVDLGHYSMFAEIEHLCHQLFGAEYNTHELRSHHCGGVHEYLISSTVLNADCVINLPKLKTHKKTGITACMKNLVGINGNKNWLPHHREGTPSQGGDQFADSRWLHRVEQHTVAAFRQVFPLLGPLRRHVARPIQAVGERIFGNTNTETIRSGNWHGNDTTWRMVIDLNRVLMYADGTGHLRNAPARRIFCIVDGIVGGEGNGPLDPIPTPAGVVLTGENPVAVDLVCARLMGFDSRHLPVLCRSLIGHPLPLSQCEADEVNCRSNDAQFNHPLSGLTGKGFVFEPHSGWKGHIEVTQE